MKRALPSPLYAIADHGDGERDTVALTRAFLAGGAHLIQLRWKASDAGGFLEAATECRRLAADAGALFIVNDRVDVALACHADGVHLGQDDVPLPDARRLLGDAAWIGVSTHDLAQARAAEAGGASYIGFGPMFTTSSKQTGYTSRGLEGLRRVRQAVSLPIVAIGGIHAAEARAVLDAGANAVAMISAIADAADTAAAVRGVLAALRSS